jgi:lysophospholipase L1-like esterase
MFKELHVDRPQPRRTMARIAGLLSVALAFAGVAACGSSSSSSSPKPSSSGASTPSASATPTLPSSPGAGEKFYVSLGDSYAAGYQPSATGKTGVTSSTGFVYRLAKEATVKGSKLEVVNFACAGATTTSLLQQNGCGPDRLGPDAVNYPNTTQAKAATDFITAHRKDVGLVSVSISGNDVTACGKVAAAQVAPCLTTALVKVKANLKTLLTELRAAAGPSTPIVGITYPDVILGAYVNGGAGGKTLAGLSVTAFKSLINPALKAAYDAINATFVDVTTATDAYVPFTQTTALAPYGTIPVSVAKVCQLTFYCQFKDIHPHDAGYQLIADLIKKALPAS